MNIAAAAAAVVVVVVVVVGPSPREVGANHPAGQFSHLLLRPSIRTLDISCHKMRHNI